MSGERYSNLPATLLQRTAIVYVRQSTQAQVVGNLESQRRQYDLVETAKAWGFRQVEVIDDDMGISASGCAVRPGFEKLVASLCAGTVGAVFCLEVSRLARNGHDWHKVLELCGLAGARVVDHDGVYDPRHPNDRLLLGMKGSISEFELGVLRARMLEAARSKARRGDLRYVPPVGYLWDRQIGVTLDPDLRVQEVVRLIFRKFRELGSARRTLLWMVEQKVHFPWPTGGVTLTSFEWRPARYSCIVRLLKNPFYAGAYAYGKTRSRIEMRDARARTAHKTAKPLEDWDVLIEDHHEGYISWDEYERNRAQLARNAFATKGGVKSGRGGRALLAGLLGCGRCGRRLHVAYRGNGSCSSHYRCEASKIQLGRPCGISFSGVGPERVVAQAILDAVSPMAIDAAVEASEMVSKARQERLAVAELEVQQARYEASLAERRYAACDPENRLIAVQLEARWEEALQRVQTLERRHDEVVAAQEHPVDPDLLHGLARDLETAWNAPQTDMRVRQRLLRTLIEDIVADIDAETGEIVLVIHWKGGRHTELRAAKPGSGAHRVRTPADALALIREMTDRWPDEAIAASLNRMGMRTASGKTWTAMRVCSIRHVNGIERAEGAILQRTSPYRTMTEAAKAFGVTNHVIRRLIRDGILPATQVVPRGPYRIRVEDLERPAVTQAITVARVPCRVEDPRQLSILTVT